jgi:hypothetical protein
VLRFGALFLVCSLIGMIVMRNSISVLLLALLAGQAEAGSPVYAVTKVAANKTGVSSVTIQMTRGFTECAALLQGTIESNETAGAPAASNACVDTLPIEYQGSFENTPVPGAIMVAYKNRDWPTRNIFYGIASDWFSEAGCAHVLKSYQARDPNAACVYSK